MLFRSLLSGPESKMGTYTTNDLSAERPRLYQFLKSLFSTKSRENVVIKNEEIFDIDKEED